MIELYVFKNWSPTKINISYGLPKEINPYYYQAIWFEKTLAKKCKEFESEIQKRSNFDVFINVDHVVHDRSYVLNLFHKWRQIQTRKKNLKEDKRREGKYLEFEKWAVGIGVPHFPLTSKTVAEKLRYNESDAITVLFMGCRSGLIDYEIKNEERVFYLKEVQ